MLFALLLPMLLALGSIVIALGNWYVHAKHYQTKVDAAAFAGGAVWGFPCGADVDCQHRGRRPGSTSEITLRRTELSSPGTLQPAAERRRRRPDLRRAESGSVVERIVRRLRLLRPDSDQSANRKCSTSRRPRPTRRSSGAGFRSSRTSNGRRGWRSRRSTASRACSRSRCDSRSHSAQPPSSTTSRARRRRSSP